MATQPGSVGEVRFSLLNETQFKAQNGNNWKLMNGDTSEYGGSALSKLFLFSGAPFDFRGYFVRGADAGKGTVTDQSEARAFTVDDILQNVLTLTVPQSPTLPSPTTFLTTGQRIKFSSTGTLPAPLVAGTIYYAMPNIFQNGKFKVATTAQNSIDTIPIDITSVGSGTHTVLLTRVVAQYGEQSAFQSHQHVGGMSTENVTHAHNYFISPGSNFKEGGTPSGSIKKIIAGTTTLSTDSVPHYHGAISFENPSISFETRPLNVSVYMYIRIN